jgi:methoxymalonate biosynthesis acyl carrier protein
MTVNDTAVKTRVRRFMSDSFEGREIADSDDIFELGFGNSLFAIQLVTFVEGTFDIEIESDDLDIANFRSVQSVTDLVERKRSQETVETSG